jgi:drug/metabolite transporter (DMT)-like permease
MGLPGLFVDANMRTVALAVLWTSVVSTSVNFYIEITTLGRVPGSEASEILATEPLWASLFAAVLFHEQFGTSEYVVDGRKGGGRVVPAVEKFKAVDGGCIIN